jgi:polyphosphate kinase 2 (PPK2 family)
LKKLSRDPELSFRVGPLDWKHFKMYDEFLIASERALSETSTEHASWEVVEGADARYRHLTTGEHLLGQLRSRLADEPRRRAQKLEEARPPAPVERRGQPTILDTLEQPPPIDEDTYEQRLLKWQGKLNQLSRKAQKAGATMLCVFEGPDAAGKGGAIRRVTRALDARYYHVVPIAAPTTEEKARHFLWRFWLKLPRRGRLVIFDRSWYGRVLVERVEGFASPREWQRGYAEIREFEELLVESGIGLVKCWLHIDPDEQARRFQEREKTSYKEFKITKEDYRNREKWPLYEDAVQEMIERTSTRSAPWTVVAANDKRHARLAVLERVCETLKDCIGRRRGAD